MGSSAGAGACMQHPRTCTARGHTHQQRHCRLGEEEDAAGTGRGRAQGCRERWRPGGAVAWLCRTAAHRRTCTAWPKRIATARHRTSGTSPTASGPISYCLFRGSQSAAAPSARRLGQAAATREHRDRRSGACDISAACQPQTRRFGLPSTLAANVAPQNGPQAGGFWRCRLA